MTSYVLTFQAREKIVIASFRSPDRTPEYARFVDGLPQAAYIFQEEDTYTASFQKTLDENRISYEKVWIDPFWIFLIDRKEKTERGIV